MHGPLPYDDVDHDWIRKDQQPQVMHCSQGQWWALALGPFTTTGGYFWDSFKVYFKRDSHYLPPTESTNGSFAFSHYALGSMDSGHRLVGYPPIHQHHYHFGYAFSDLAETVPNWPPYIGASENMATHGENQCHDDEGGVACHVHSAPPQFAFMARAPLKAANTYNDVRPRHSAPLKTWEIMATKSVAVTTETKRLTLSYVMAFGAGSMSSRLTYTINTAHDAVVWNEGMPAAGPVVEAYMHAHADHLHDVWLFQAHQTRSSTTSSRHPTLSEGLITRHRSSQTPCSTSRLAESSQTPRRSCARI